MNEKQLTDEQVAEVTGGRGGGYRKPVFKPFDNSSNSVLCPKCNSKNIWRYWQIDDNLYECQDCKEHFLDSQTGGGNIGDW